MKNPFLIIKYLTIVFMFLICVVVFFPSCASNDIRAEEYYSIGMAYYEMGKYAEAERWLIRARAADKTMTASDYNLGRIAFETGRYEEAAKHFERILLKDPENVIVLKAAAYSRIKNGDLEMAEAHYNKVLILVPESADDGFNYALVLYGLEKYENCEEVLNRYPFALEESSSSLLLLARAQKAQDKVEAVDTYAKWVIVSAEAVSPQGLYEYAQVLENAEFYARALEQYDEAIKTLTKDTEDLKKSTLRFSKARLLLTQDPENPEGISELNTAAKEGFDDTKALELLLSDGRVTKTNKDHINKILNDIKSKMKASEEDASKSEELPAEEESTSIQPSEETEENSRTSDLE